MNARLLELIDYHLMNALVESERPESVIPQVLEEYTSDLKRQGMIPQAFEDDVLEELRDVARDTIRKRTYGFITIQDFKKHSEKKK